MGVRKGQKRTGTADYTFPKPETAADALLELDREYEAKSGRAGILYTSNPKGNPVYVFADGTQKRSRSAAIRYLKDLLLEFS